MLKTIQKIGARIVSVAILTMPLTALAQWGSADLGRSGLASTSVSALIINAMNWLLYILGFLAIIGFVISGILYLTAYGEEKQIERAKTAMLYSIVGILVALVGFIAVKAISGFLGGNSTF